MKTRTRFLILAICLTVLIPEVVIAQSLDAGARGRAAASTLSRSGAAARPATQTASTEAASLESVVPREGLKLYVEIRNGGLTELVKSSSAIQSFAKLLSTGQVQTPASDLASFVMGNLGLLSNARVALAGYNAGTLVLIETANAADAEQLQPAVATLVGRSRKSKASGSVVEATLLGRVVLIGPRELAAKLARMTAAVSLAGDQEFMKARGRFEKEQFFAYIDIGSMSRSLPQGAMTPGAMAALSGIPAGIALGGSITGDAAVVRALMVNGSGQPAGLLPGLFSSLASATQAGQPMASAFASADTDLFVDVMLDWDRLYDAIQSMLAMFAGSFAYGGTANAGALPPAQTADLLGMLETSLGFSIKHDLLPTLGSEVAFSMSGLSRTLSPKQASAVGPKQAPGRFLLIVALKDPAGFDKLIARLFKRTASPTTQFTRSPYRGVMVTSNKSMAYAIVNGFFVAGGGAVPVRRAIDAQASGVSLASSDAFKSAFDSSQQAALQAYLSPSFANELFESLLKASAKSNGLMVSPSAVLSRMPIAIQLIPDSDGVMIEARLPANLALLALASMAGGGNSPRPRMTPLPAGVGISEPGPRVSGDPRTPRMTDDDLRRRP